MKDMILTGLACICAGGMIFFSVLFVAFAGKMQRMEGADKP